MIQNTKFGTDNCTNRHICNRENLVVGKITKVTNIGIKGVGGITEAVGPGKIKYWLTNSDSNN